MQFEIIFYIHTYSHIHNIYIGSIGTYGLPNWEQHFQKCVKSVKFSGHQRCSIIEQSSRFNKQKNIFF